MCICAGLFVTTKAKTCSVCVYVFQNIAETPASTSESKVRPVMHSGGTSKERTLQSHSFVLCSEAKTPQQQKNKHAPEGWRDEKVGG